jgi:hypothetical protein
VSVTDEEVIDLDVRRTAANVANYYWVAAGYSQTIGAPIMTSALIDKGNAFSILNYPNSGGEPVRISAHEGRYRTISAGRWSNRICVPRADAALIDFIGEKRAQRIAQNQDNVVFEAGTRTLRGREDIRAGEYVNLRLGTNGSGRAGLEQQAYAYSVTHEFAPYKSFTTIQFDRGSGFIARAQ